MYARRKIPAPFRDKIRQKIDTPEEKPISIQTAAAEKKPLPNTSPLLALLFLDYFSTQKKGDE